MSQELKVALLLCDWNIPAWQLALLTELLDSDYACVDLVIRADKRSSEISRRGLTYSLFETFGRREKTRPIDPDACAVTNAQRLLGNIDCIPLSLESADGSSRNRVAQIAAIKSKEVDVIYAIDDISPIDMLLSASKYGVWFYDYSYGQSGPIDCRLIGFWEVLRHRPFVRSALRIRSASFQRDRTAYVSYSGVDPLSHATTRNEHLWKIRAFVPRTLWKLYAGDREHFLRDIRDNEPTSGSNTSLGANNLSYPNKFFSLLTYALKRMTLKILRRYFSEKWILMYRLGGDPRKLDEYIKIHPPADWFWADPHVLREGDYYYVFFEEASVETGSGHISVMRMDDSGDYSKPTRILERPYHLSYPFIFEWKLDKYLIAETADNRTVEVYRCKEFPYKWEYHSTLMEDVSAYDVTLFEHNDTWWLFANIREHEGASTWDELCLFSSDNPLSDDWQPHPMNPIISDVRTARQAGPILRRKGRIYRPSQNSSFRYGYGLNFNEILELTKSTYKERLIESYEPNWDRSIQALHSFSTADDLVFIDAIYRINKFRNNDVQS